MTLAVMPKEPIWWVWFVTVVLLAFGVCELEAPIAALSALCAQTNLSPQTQSPT